MRRLVARTEQMRITSGGESRDSFSCFPCKVVSGICSLVLTSLRCLGVCGRLGTLDARLWVRVRDLRVASTLIGMHGRNAMNVLFSSWVVYQ
jgi:hypothetical protein